MGERTFTIHPGQTIHNRHMDTRQLRPIQFDLEERTFQFAKNSRDFLGKIPRTIVSIEHIKQLARCTGSVGANYTEANDALGRNDFLVKVKIARREAKECVFWLRLLDLQQRKDLEEKRQTLTTEAHELVCILSAILHNSTKKHVVN